MPSYHRYAFLYEDEDGDRDEYETAGKGLTAAEAVERAYASLPDGVRLVKTLRGDIPDGLDLTPPDNPNVATSGNLDLPDEADDGSDSESEADGDEEVDEE